MVANAIIKRRRTLRTIVATKNPISRSVTIISTGTKRSSSDTVLITLATAALLFMSLQKKQIVHFNVIYACIVSRLYKIILTQ